MLALRPVLKFGKTVGGLRLNMSSAVAKAAKWRGAPLNIILRLGMVIPWPMVPSLEGFSRTTEKGKEVIKLKSAKEKPAAALN